jgi:hypothetical protein
MPINTKPNVELNTRYSLAGSTHETIDYALYNFLNDTLNVYCTTNGGFTKVPVIFSIPERAYQVKNQNTLRPNARTLNYPLMSISKESMNRNPANRGRYGVGIYPYFTALGGGTLDIARTINQDKTKNFANANSIRKSATKKDKNYQTFPENNKEIVYQTMSIPMPSFVEITYKITAITDYQQQMNQILQVFQNFTSTPGVFNIEHEGNKYEAFLSPDFTIENNAAGLDVDERKFQSNISIMVLGYLIGKGQNQEYPNVVVRESAAKIQIQRERVVLGDEVPYHAGKKVKYRP